MFQVFHAKELRVLISTYSMEEQALWAAFKKENTVYQINFLNVKLQKNHTFLKYKIQ